MAISKVSAFLYDKVFRKTSTFVVAIGLTAIFADQVVDTVAEGAWAKINEGRLWKDVKKNIK